RDSDILDLPPEIQNAPCHLIWSFSIYQPALLHRYRQKLWPDDQCFYRTDHPIISQRSPDTKHISTESSGHRTNAAAVDQKPSAQTHWIQICKWLFSQRLRRIATGRYPLTRHSK
ncbi:hypothetical protein COCVIDRAFT_93717, partial [Bipolaris victoriae FI3]